MWESPEKVRKSSGIPEKVLYKFLRKPWEVLRNYWLGLDKSPETVLRDSWESPEKILRKSWESLEKVLRKFWEISEKVLRKSWESPEKFPKKSTEKVLRKSWESSEISEFVTF